MLTLIDANDDDAGDHGGDAPSLQRAKWEFPKRRRPELRRRSDVTFMVRTFWTQPSRKHTWQTRIRAHGDKASDQSSRAPSGH